MKTLINDIKIRKKNLQDAMRKLNMEGCLISTNVNVYYLTGMIFNGYLYISINGEVHYFVKQPVGLSDNKVIYINKPEQIPDLLKEKGVKIPETLLMEEDELAYSEYIRLHTIFKPQKTGNASSLMRTIRAVKTPYEINQLKISGKKHSSVYFDMMSCYRKGMRDLDLQYRIEYIMRKNGSLGLFRAFGSNMDNFMGTVLAGDNAGAPSPYNFALGGAGFDNAHPIGANGTVIKKGMTVMIDMAGNFTPYITDMSRVFSLGEIPEKAHKAHNISILIHNELKSIAKPGISCSELYNVANKIVEKEKLSDFFMGTKQQAKFIGHGIGLQINELPVITARSKEILQQNMVIAIEPKFVIPGIGAVGIENSYLVTENGIKNITVFTEKILSF